MPQLLHINIQWPSLIFSLVLLINNWVSSMYVILLKCRKSFSMTLQKFWKPFLTSKGPLHFIDFISNACCSLLMLHKILAELYYDFIGQIDCMLENVPFDSHFIFLCSVCKDIFLKVIVDDSLTTKDIGTKNKVLKIWRYCSLSYFVAYFFTFALFCVYGQKTKSMLKQKRQIWSFIWVIWHIPLQVLLEILLIEDMCYLPTIVGYKPQAKCSIEDSIFFHTPLTIHS